MANAFTTVAPHNFTGSELLQNSCAVFVVDLGGKYLTYSSIVNHKLELAWRKGVKEFEEVIRTVGGEFLYKLQFKDKIDRTLPSKSREVGVQINTVSGIDRKNCRFDLKELRSPNGSIWYYEDVGDQKVKNGAEAVNFDRYKNIFSPAACVVLDRQFHFKRSQVLLLEKGEHPIVVSFKENDLHPRYDIVSRETVSVLRVDPSNNPQVRDASSTNSRAIQTKAGAMAKPVSLTAFSPPTALSKSTEIVMDPKQGTLVPKPKNPQWDSFMLKCKRKANQMYPLFMRAAYRAVQQGNVENVVVPTKSELFSFLLAQVDGVAKMVVKDRKTSVLDSIWAALADGVAGLSGPGALALAKLSKMQLRYVFSTLMKEDRPVSAAVCKYHVTTLVDSWVSCTAEQVRATDRLYGILSGRELSFPQEVLLALDRYKDLVVEKLAIWMASTVSKGSRYPHMKNCLIREFAKEFGLSGSESAAQDPYILPPLPMQSKDLARAKFYELFDPIEFATGVMTDINVQDESAERTVYAKALTQFVQVGANGFAPHAILYNDDDALYYEKKPENAYDVFVHLGVTLDIIELALLKVGNDPYC
eukprot:m.124462 g.124462  ORF g.124462 m.124462 type:complete len:587 (-) comp14472_c0_seq2:52-1812(-)